MVGMKFIFWKKKLNTEIKFCEYTHSSHELDSTHRISVRRNNTPKDMYAFGSIKYVRKRAEENIRLMLLKKGRKIK